MSITTVAGPLEISTKLCSAEMVTNELAERVPAASARKQQSEPNAFRVMMVMMASNRLSSQGKATEYAGYTALPPRKNRGS